MTFTDMAHALEGLRIPIGDELSPAELAAEPASAARVLKGFRRRSWS